MGLRDGWDELPDGWLDGMLGLACHGMAWQSMGGTDGSTAGVVTLGLARHDEADGRAG